MRSLKRSISTTLINEKELIMKRTVFIFLFLSILGGFVFAQSKWNFENDITGTEGYEGLWIYQSNDTIFKLRLIKCASPKMKWRHFLGGLYSISIGGKEIESTMEKEFNHLPPSATQRNPPSFVYPLPAYAILTKVLDGE